MANQTKTGISAKEHREIDRKKKDQKIKKLMAERKKKKKK